MTLQEVKAQSSGLSLEMNYLGRSDTYLGDTWKVQFIVTNHGDDTNYAMYAFADNYDIVLPISFNDTFFLKHGENEFTVHFQCFESGTTNYGFYISSGNYEIKESITCPLSETTPQLTSASCTFNGPGTNFHECNLSGATFTGADFSNADLTNAYLSKGDFSGADLTDAILINANLRAAIFDNTILNNADFSDVEDVTHLNTKDTEFNCVNHEKCTPLAEDQIIADKIFAKELPNLPDFNRAYSNLDTFDYSMPDRFGLD